MSTASESSIRPIGLTEIHTPENNALVDIVFVHGLAGHPHTTWTSKQKRTFWPAQLLPPIVEEERARILVYGYDADVASFTDGLPCDKIHNHAEHLVAELCANRRFRKATERPILFVSHSLGGLIVKRALIYSSEIRGIKTEHLRSIFVSTYGILFLGTPHKRPTDTTWGLRLAKICVAVLPSTLIEAESHLLHTLQTNSETLINIDRQFIQLVDKFCIYFFHEGKSTLIEGAQQYVVEEDAASPIIQDVERAVIQKSHVDMCKFDDDGSPGFNLVVEAIQRYAAEAPKMVTHRWVFERDERQTRRTLKISELDDTNHGTEPLSLGSSSGQATRLNSHPSIVSSQTAGVEERQNKRHYLVPQNRVKNFVGREALLQQIFSHFSSKSAQQPNVLVLYALGGQGKTQLVLQYCQQQRKHYRGIFWVNARSEESALQSYAEIARALNGRSSTSSEDRDQTIEFVIECLEAWDEAWLLIFDNYDETAMFPEPMRFFPRSEHGHVIFTSRRGDLDRLGFLREVTALNAEEGVALLLSGSSDEVRERCSTTASQIVIRLGGLALAIDQAAAYIRYRYRILSVQNLEEFMTTYENERKRILSFVPGPFWEYQSVTAFTTWEMSLDQLSCDTKLEKDQIVHFLTLSAFFNAARIEEDLFRTHWLLRDLGGLVCYPLYWLRAIGGQDAPSNKNIVGDNVKNYGPDMGIMLDNSIGFEVDRDIQEDKQERPTPEISLKENCEARAKEEWQSDRFWAVLSRLNDLSLLQDIMHTSQGARFSLHPLIQDWLQLRGQISPNRKIEESLHILAAYAINVEQMGIWAFQQRTVLMAHVDSALAKVESSKVGKYRTCNLSKHCSVAFQLGLFYINLGYDNKAEQLFSESVERETDTVVERDCRTLGTTSLYSVLYLVDSMLNQGKYDKAEALGRRAVEWRTSVLGNEHARTLEATVMWAVTLTKQGKLDEAEGLLRRVLDLQKTILGEAHEATLDTMTSLAHTLQDQSRYGEMEEISRRILELQSNAVVQRPRHILYVMGRLSSALLGQGRYKEATVIERDRLRLAKTTYGHDHGLTARATWYLATSLMRAGCKSDEVAQILREAVHLRQKSFGIENDTTLKMMHTLARFYRERNEFTDECEDVHRQLLQSRERLLGKEHLDTLMSAFQLGHTLEKRGKYEEAESKFRQSMSLRQKVLGEENRDTLKSMVCLAHVLERRKKYEDVESLLRKAVPLVQALLGKEHPDTLGCMYWLGKTLTSREKYEEAEPILRQVVDLRRRLSENGQPETILSMKWLSMAVRRQGKHSEASEMDQQIHNIKQSTSTE